MFYLKDDEEIDNLTVGANCCSPKTESPHIIKNKSLLPMNKKQASEKREDCHGDDFPVIEDVSQYQRLIEKCPSLITVVKNWIKRLITTILSYP